MVKVAAVGSLAPKKVRFNERHLKQRTKTQQLAGRGQKVPSSRKDGQREPANFGPSQQPLRAPTASRSNSSAAESRPAGRAQQTDLRLKQQLDELWDDRRPYLAGAEVLHKVQSWLDVSCEPEQEPQASPRRGSDPAWCLPSYSRTPSDESELEPRPGNRGSHGKADEGLCCSSSLEAQAVPEWRIRTATLQQPQGAADSSAAAALHSRLQSAVSVGPVPLAAAPAAKQRQRLNEAPGASHYRTWSYWCPRPWPAGESPLGLGVRIVDGILVQSPALQRRPQSIGVQHVKGTPLPRKGYPCLNPHLELKPPPPDGGRRSGSAFRYRGRPPPRRPGNPKVIRVADIVAAGLADAPREPPASFGARLRRGAARCFKSFADGLGRMCCGPEGSGLRGLAWETAVNFQDQCEAAWFAGDDDRLYDRLMRLLRRERRLLYDDMYGDKFEPRPLIRSKR